ncbi:rCG39171 [Rattus norvegicus]|uniref:RCG39171 n=1 Tax=Rattus norvegicus TaxID=10116 RepID=A6KMK0_RAT|nr:rCG39171 [Rattus norvegicus]
MVLTSDTPSQQGVAFNSRANQRVIQIVEVQKDPTGLQNPKLRKFPRDHLLLLRL